MPASSFLVAGHSSHWAAIPELVGRYLRVVTLEDKITIHNAFPDRGENRGRELV
jgi:hypothetical protein